MRSSPQPSALIACAPPRCYSGPRGARHEKARTRCVSHAPRGAAPRADQRSLSHRRRHGGEPRAVPRPDRSRLAGRQPQPPPPHPRPRAQAHLEDRRGTRAHRGRLVRQVRGLRGGHRHRAVEGAPGDHALHRLQVAPGSAGAEAPHLVSRPRKAVIPAAGLGTRFLPATKAVPKELLPIVDVPTIQYIVQEVVSSGLTEVVLVSGRGKSAIEDHFDVSPELERFLEEKGKHDLLALVREVSKMVHVVSVRQKQPLGLGHAVLTARRYVGNEPFAVLLGDVIIDAAVPCTRQLLDVYATHGPVIALLAVPPEKAHLYGIISGTPVRDRSYHGETLVDQPPA